MRGTYYGTAPSEYMIVYLLTTTDGFEPITCRDYTAGFTVTLSVLVILYLLQLST